MKVDKYLKEREDLRTGGGSMKVDRYLKELAQSTRRPTTLVSSPLLADTYGG